MVDVARSLCPVCGRETPALPHLSGDGSYVFYFRCDACRHIWTVNKASGHINHVTPLRPTKLADDYPMPVTAKRG
jgi:hypothetical protein